MSDFESEMIGYFVTVIVVVLLAYLGSKYEKRLR